MPYSERIDLAPFYGQQPEWRDLPEDSRSGVLQVHNASQYDIVITLSDGYRDLTPAYSSQRYDLCGSQGYYFDLIETLDSNAPPTSYMYVVAVAPIETRNVYTPSPMARHQNIGNSALNVEGTAVGGVVFPSSPFVGQVFYRSDRGSYYYWNGTYWLSVAEYEHAWLTQNAQPLTASFQRAGIAPLDRTYATYWTRAIVRMRPAGTGANNAANYWELRIGTSFPNVNSNNRILWAPTTQAQAINVPAMQQTAIDLASVIANEGAIYLEGIQNGGTPPSQLFIEASVKYRLIG